MCIRDSPQQHGFRCDRSTETAASSLVDYVERHISSGSHCLATFRAPRDQSIHSALNAGDQQRRIGAPTEHCAVICKSNPKSILVVTEADCLIESQGPEGRRANAPLGEAHCYATKLNRDERTENETMLYV